jgi:hypothetical protein
MSLGYEFAPIDVTILTHPRAFAAGVDAMGLWLWGMAFAKWQRTSGRLHRVAVLAAWGGKRNIMLAKRLVESGLWIARDDGDWEIHNFEKKGPGSAFNSTSSTERMRRLRERRKPSLGDVTTSHLPSHSDASHVTCASLSTSSSLSSSSREGEFEREVESSGVRYSSAYEAGIARGKCTPYVWPGTKYAEWDLGKIIKGFAKDPEGVAYRGDQLLRWIEHTAGEFASDVTSRNKSQYYSSFDPRGCLKWLNEDALAEEARRVG